VIEDQHFDQASYAPSVTLGSQRPAIYGVGWIGSAPEDYDREYCVDLAQRSAFLRETQPEAAEALGGDSLRHPDLPQRALQEPRRAEHRAKDHGGTCTGPVEFETLSGQRCSDGSDGVGRS